MTVLMARNHPKDYGFSLIVTVVTELVTLLLIVTKLQLFLLLQLLLNRQRLTLRNGMCYNIDRGLYYDKN